MISLTTEIDDVLLYIEGEVTYDHNCGADADGNRGIGVWFVEDVLVRDATTTEKDGQNLIELLTEEMSRKIDELLIEEAQSE